MPIKTVYRVLPVDAQYQKRAQSHAKNWNKHNDRRRTPDRRGARIDNRLIYNMRCNHGRRKGDLKRSIINTRV